MTRLLAVLFVVLATSWPSIGPNAATVHSIAVVTDPESGLPRFDPPIAFIEPGDAVRIEMEGKVFASRLIAGMHPPGVSGWWGQVGETVEITFTEPGVYGHKCGGTYSLGLVGLIVVGDPSPNLESARAVQHPPLAAKVLQDLFEELTSAG